MPSDYERISRENLEEYGCNRTGWREDLLVDLYADRTHFVFELLQNAEDALGRPNGTRGSGRVSFVLTHDAVHFSHYGDPFTTDDVRGVCAIARRTKERDLTAIGRFGIGFKSVYAITDSPEVHSGDEHFTVKDYVQPAAVTRIALAEGETVITLPLKESAKADDIVGQFERLGDERTLLFLREINEIEWSAEGGRSGSHRREEAVEADGVRRVTLLSEAEGEDREEEVWLIFSREVHHEGTSAGYVELAFRIAADDDGAEAVDVIDDSRLAAFFPTEFPTHLGMLVQGPYRTTPARDNIPRDDAWNRYLVGETASLLVDALRHLRDCRLITPRVFDALPLSRQRFSGTFFAPLFDAVHEAVASEPLLPAYRGGYVAASQARLTSNEDLRHLVSRGQLAELLGEDEPVAWLAPEISRNETLTLYRYLMDEHDVRELNTDDLLQRLCKQFIENQRDWWIARLYGFLGRGDTWEECEYLLYDVPFIRLEDGTHTAPGDEADAFLPTALPSAYPNTVHPAVCNTRPAWKFLVESVGLRTPDLVDDIASDVLPRYREAGFTIAEDEYVADLQRFVSVYATDSRERSRRLVAALRDTPFVLAADAATCEQSFVRPADAYLATERLRALFDGVPGVLLVDDSLDRKEVTELLGACGAWRTLAPVDVGHRFTHDERREVRRRAGWEWDITLHRGETVTDWEFRGLKALLEYLPELSREDAEDRARVLWDALREVDQHSFRGRYAWFYRKRRQSGFHSASVRLLNDTAWVPDGSGGLQPPNRVKFATTGWTEEPFLQSIIKFRQPELPSPRDALARRAGVDAAALDELKEWQNAGLSLDEMREARLALRRRREGGGSETTRPGGAANGDDAGNTGSGPASGGERVFESYIRVDTGSERTEEGSREHDRRMGLEKEAIALIQKREPALKGTRPNNPGYDLYEVGEGGEPLRWVEVKALAEGWESRPVTLTHTQFEYARKKGEAYWLYVVEHAGAAEANVVKIMNPAGRASTYTFDEGWRDAPAEGASA